MHRCRGDSLWAEQGFPCSPHILAKQLLHRYVCTAINIFMIDLHMAINESYLAVAAANAASTASVSASGFKWTLAAALILGALLMTVYSTYESKLDAPCQNAFKGVEPAHQTRELCEGGLRVDVAARWPAAGEHLDTGSVGPIRACFRYTFLLPRLQALDGPVLLLGPVDHSIGRRMTSILRGMRGSAPYGTSA